jgi:hypothetical protein
LASARKGGLQRARLGLKPSARMFLTPAGVPQPPPPHPQPPTPSPRPRPPPSAPAPAPAPPQVFTAVEDFALAMGKLRELGFSVNAEACELVYRPGAEVEVDDEAFTK